jgi:hypothetical protein
MKVMNQLARYAASHDGIKAHATATHIIMVDRDGNIKLARRFTTVREWLGY